jgi:hypothetical protein
MLPSWWLVHVVGSGFDVQRLTDVIVTQNDQNGTDYKTGLIAIRE